MCSVFQLQSFDLNMPGDYRPGDEIMQTTFVRDDSRFIIGH
jgi:hypothetical protein